MFDELAPPYGTIVADPPWRYDVSQRLAGGERKRTKQGTYGRMSIEEICALPVADLAAASAHLWLWVTNGIVAGGAHGRVLDAWGFRPITMLTWRKTGAPGIGSYLRGQTEHAVLAVRGWGTCPATTRETTVFDAPRRGHSVKPGAFFDIVHRLSPGPYLELFARSPQLGWDSWGNGWELVS